MLPNSPEVGPHVGEKIGCAEMPSTDVDTTSDYEASFDGEVFKVNRKAVKGTVCREADEFFAPVVKLLGPGVVCECIPDCPCPFIKTRDADGEWWIWVHQESVHGGLRFPLHSFIVKVLDLYHLVPGQLGPNAHRMLVLFLLGCHRAEISPSLELFNYMVQALPCSGESDGYVQFQARGNRKYCKVPSHNKKGWKERYFFVKMDPQIMGFGNKWSSKISLFPQPQLDTRLDDMVDKIKLLNLCSEDITHENLASIGIGAPYLGSPKVTISSKLASRGSNKSRPVSTGDEAEAPKRKLRPKIRVSEGSSASIKQGLSPQSVTPTPSSKDGTRDALTKKRKLGNPNPLKTFQGRSPVKVAMTPSQLPPSGSITPLVLGSPFSKSRGHTVESLTKARAEAGSFRAMPTKAVQRKSPLGSSLSFSEDLAGRTAAGESSLSPTSPAREVIVAAPFCPASAPNDTSAFSPSLSLPFGAVSESSGASELQTWLFGVLSQMAQAVWSKVEELAENRDLGSRLSMELDQCKKELAEARGQVKDLGNQENALKLELQTQRANDEKRILDLTSRLKAVETDRDDLIIKLKAVEVDRDDSIRKLTAVVADRDDSIKKLEVEQDKIVNNFNTAQCAMERTRAAFSLPLGEIPRFTNQDEPSELIIGLRQRILDLQQEVEQLRQAPEPNLQDLMDRDGSLDELFAMFAKRDELAGYFLQELASDPELGPFYQHEMIRSEHRGMRSAQQSIYDYLDQILDPKVDFRRTWNMPEILKDPDSPSWEVEEIPPDENGGNKCDPMGVEVPPEDSSFQDRGGNVPEAVPDEVQTTKEPDMNLPSSSGGRC